MNSPCYTGSGKEHLKNKLVNAKYIYLIVFSKEAKHIYKAAKQVPEKNLESFSSEETIWMTLLILKNSHSSQISEILSILQKINKYLTKQTGIRGGCHTWFLNQKKSNFNIQQLFKKTSFESVDKKGDMDCSIQERKKWLKVWKD